MNRAAIEKIAWILKTMRQEAGNRNAPVNKIAYVTKNDPFRSLVFTILSSRTKDEKTIDAAKKLLKIAPTPDKLAAMQVKRIESAIRSVGFYRVKAKNLKRTAKMLIERFNGKVPESRNDLILLPGVGRKTANVVLVYVFKKNEIPVDIHVHRISNRLGFVKTKNPEETEKALRKIIPEKQWRSLNHAFVAYGQTVCLPRIPKCRECRFKKICWRVGVESS
jgi:endonuclease-3